MRNQELGSGGARGHLRWGAGWLLELRAGSLDGVSHPFLTGVRRGFLIGTVVSEMEFILLL